MEIVIIVAVVVLAVAVTAVATLTRGQALVELEARFRTPLAPAQARSEGFATLLELMADEEFALVTAGPDRARFQRRARPLWTLYVAAILWPFGLLALSRRTWIVVDVELRPDGVGSVVLLTGTVPARLWDRLQWTFGRDA